MTSLLNMLPSMRCSILFLSIYFSFSSGLYDKVILQGGYGLSRQWALMDNPLERASELGRLLDFKGETVEQLWHFLKNMPVEKLMKGCAALRPFTRRVKKFVVNLR